MTRRFLPAISALAWLLCACALTSKSDPWITRYFSPEYAERPSVELSEAARRGSDGARLELRLGRVSSQAHLRQRIAFRTSDHELNYYEDRRWTERPEVYLDRALGRALFEERGLVRVVSGNAPTLEVELLAFEEVAGQRPLARMQAVMLLHDWRRGRLERTIMVERPIATAGERDDRASAIARAMADSLSAGVARIAQLVVDELAASPAAHTSPCTEMQTKPEPSVTDAGAKSRAAALHD
jgi:uncharacterized lipoprotein YmbA